MVSKKTSSFFEKPLDKLEEIWYNIKVACEEASERKIPDRISGTLKKRNCLNQPDTSDPNFDKHRVAEKKVEKTFAKPLDKRSEIWYNI